MNNFSQHKNFNSNSKIFKNAWNPGLINNQNVFKDISKRFVSNNLVLINSKKEFRFNSKRFQQLDLSIFRQRKKATVLKIF